jgi:hypothetical protein
MSADICVTVDGVYIWGWALQQATGQLLLQFIMLLTSSIIRKNTAIACHAKQDRTNSGKQQIDHRDSAASKLVQLELLHREKHR